MTGFHSALADTWNARYRRGGFKRRLMCARTLLEGAVGTGERWLDAGCGAGRLTLEMSRLGAWGLAVDRSREMIDAASREVVPLSTAFEFRTVPSIGSIDEDNESFDGVLCSSVIEYVDGVDTVLLEFNRLLRVGGKLMLSTPNRRSVVRQTQKACRRVGLMAGFDPFPYLAVSVHEFTRRDLLHRLSRFGFRTRTVEAFDPIVPPMLTTVFPCAMHFVVSEKALPDSTPFAATPPIVRSCCQFGS